MEKLIISYDLQNGIQIACTQIQETEHQQARDEISTLGFFFENIDADSFSASIETATPEILEKLESLGYRF